MGMYDNVDAPTIECKECGERVGGWQTKDGDVSLSYRTLDTVDNFYGSCEKCGSWYEFKRKGSSDLDNFNCHMTRKTVEEHERDTQENLDEMLSGMRDSAKADKWFDIVLARASSASAITPNDACVFADICMEGLEERYPSKKEK